MWYICLYLVLLFAEDTHWDELLKIYLGLEDTVAPAVPSIDGPEEGNPGQEYEYILSSDDPQSDNVCFYIEWGNSTFEWTNLELSGEESTVSHMWEEKGTYTINVKAIDQYCAASDWATLEGTMQRNRVFSSPLLKFLQSNPYILSLLQKILGL